MSNPLDGGLSCISLLITRFTHVHTCSRKHVNQHGTVYLKDVHAKIFYNTGFFHTCTFTTVR